MMQPEALACTTEAAMPIYFYTKQTPMRQTGRHHGVEPTPRTQWRARDGGLITVFGVPRTEASWRTLMEWMEGYEMGQELRGEPRYQEAFVGGARSYSVFGRASVISSDAWMPTRPTTALRGAATPGAWCAPRRRLWRTLTFGTEASSLEWSTRSWAEVTSIRALLTS